MRAERAETGEHGPQFMIRGIEGDMGEDTQLNILIEEEGDAILEIVDTKTFRRLEIQFCTSQGGGHNPGLALKLREVAELLYKNQKSKQG